MTFKELAEQIDESELLIQEARKACEEAEGKVRAAAAVLDEKLKSLNGAISQRDSLISEMKVKMGLNPTTNRQPEPDQHGLKDLYLKSAAQTRK